MARNQNGVRSRYKSIPHYLKQKPRRSVGVLVVHGIGVPGPEYCQPLQENVSRILNGPEYEVTNEDGDKYRTRHSEWVRWREVYWSDITRANQQAYLGASTSVHRRGRNWRWINSRDLVLKGLGDAAAYQLVGDNANHVYQSVQARVRAGFESLLDRTYPERPVVVIAHCVGSHVASTFIYDTLKRSRDTRRAQEFEGSHGVRLSTDEVQKKRELEFLSMKTLCSFITLGSSLPMFSFGLEEKDIQPIALPPPYDAAIDGRQVWLNYYYKSDVLGYPLRCINAAYEQAVDEDIGLHLGLRLPMKPKIEDHGAYWRDERIAHDVAKILIDLVTAEPRAPERANGVRG